MEAASCLSTCGHLDAASWGDKQRKRHTMVAFRPPPKLGIGVSYHPALRVALDASHDLIDFVEISPDILCYERVIAGQRQLDYHPTMLDDALRWSAPRPIVVHGLGLSIGTVDGWNDGYLRILDRFYTRQ